MKILFLTTSYPAYNGHHQSPFIHNLAKTLVKQGHEIRVIAPRYKESKSVYEKIDGVKVNRFKGFENLVSGGGIATNLKSSKLAMLNFPKFVSAMKKEAKKFVKDYDIIHTQWVLSGLAGVSLKNKYNKPLILTTRGADLQKRSFITNSIVNYVLKNCDYITPNNLHQVKPIRKIVTLPLQTVPNGVDTDLFKKYNHKKLRKELDLPEKTTILFVGWLIPRKDPETLIRAFAKLNMDAQLVLVGSGSLESDMKKLVRYLQIQDKVIFVGAKPPTEMHKWYGASDIFVLPSLSEGRPNVVLESISSANVVVATNIEGTNEVIKHNENGLLVPIKDVDSLRDALFTSLTNKKLAQKLSKSARKYIETSGYTWENCAKTYSEIYSKFVD